MKCTKRTRVALPNGKKQKLSDQDRREQEVEILLDEIRARRLGKPHTPIDELLKGCSKPD